ncbi:hypothetical protein TgHK011_000706 [Trichoderma gracile]|nr:hypothetical protein TgHK011_000706 [Trichoderma gracile]
MTAEQLQTSKEECLFDIISLGNQSANRVSQARRRAAASGVARFCFVNYRPGVLYRKLCSSPPACGGNSDRVMACW